MHRGIDPRRIGRTALAQIMRKLSVIIILVKRPCDAQLPVVIHAIDLMRLCFRAGEYRQQQSGQDRDDCNDHQKLNERKAGPLTA